MATVIDSLVISLGLDPTPVKSGLNQLAGLAAKFAGPIAGAFSINKIVSGYMKDVGEVARMTGRYSQKLEEWRYKRAMLARVTREDIDLYKKCREGVVKFNIAMADLSAKIVRGFHPAIKLGVDILNRFSGWVKENEHNIARFFMVTAGVITAVFIPALVKMGLALLWNPLTGLIIALGVLILVLDDLITYARGGRSVFADFWAKFGTPEEVKQKLIAFLEKCKKLLADYLPLIVKIVGALLGLSAARGVFYLIEKALGGVGKALGVVGKVLGRVLGVVGNILGKTLGVVGKALGVVGKALLILLRHPALLFLMAAAYFIYQRWDGMVEGMEALIADLISVWEKAVDWTANYIGKIAQGWKDLTGDLSAAYNKVINFTVELMEKAVNGVKDLRTKAVNALAGMIESLAGVLSRTWEGVKDGFNSLVDDLTAAWKRSPLYTMFTTIIEGVNAAKEALGIGGDEEQKTAGGIGAVGDIAAAAAKTLDLSGLWGDAKNFLGAKFSAVPNVNQQTSAMTTSVGKQHNGDVNIDNSQNITVNGNVGDPAELAETMNKHRTTADLSDSGTYLN
jgi:phage-related protein